MKVPAPRTSMGENRPNPWELHLSPGYDRHSAGGRHATRQQIGIAQDQQSAKPTTLQKAMRRPWRSGGGGRTTGLGHRQQGRRRRQEGRWIGTREGDRPPRRAQGRQDGRRRICRETGGLPIGDGQERPPSLASETPTAVKASKRPRAAIAPTPSASPLRDATRNGCRSEERR